MKSQSFEKLKDVLGFHLTMETERMEQWNLNGMINMIEFFS